MGNKNNNNKKLSAKTKPLSDKKDTTKAIVVDETDAKNTPEATDKSAKVATTKAVPKDKEIVVLIPMFEPDEKMCAAVDEILESGFEHIVLVDDGSDDEYQKYFDKVKDKTTIVVHTVNQGKGRAIKTGLNYIKANHSNLAGIIVADGDGQHPIEAICAVRDAMSKHPDKLVLGVRQFAKGNVPIKNLLGNIITIGVFLGLTLTKFSDTQCGLRGFPLSIIDDMILTKGERFEYENIMLIDVRCKQLSFVEVPMQALYIKENQTSHFNKITDSISIYASILKFALYPAFTGVVAFVYSYIFFLRSLCIDIYSASLIYAQGLLIGWLLLSLVIKKTKMTNTLLILLSIFTSTAIFYFLFMWLGVFAGAWWIAAIVVAFMNYCLFLRCKYGKRGKRIRIKKDKTKSKKKDKHKKTKRDKKNGKVKNEKKNK